MIRKLILFATFLFSIVSVSAQTVGDWKMYTLFPGEINKVVDTPDIVYFTSGTRLFSYNKATNESYAYTTQNKLNDINATVIEYNPEGKYLFVGYDNSNIDLIYDNGRVINMADIKDASLTYNKDIHSVNFANNRIYVATEFGIIIFDDKRHEVVESGIFGTPVQSVFPLGEYLILHRNSSASKSIAASPLNGHHNTLSKFTTLNNNINAEWLKPLGENLIVFPDGANKSNLTVMSFSVDNDIPTLSDGTALGVVPNQELALSKAGNFITTSTQIVYLDKDGQISQRINIPSALNLHKIGTWNGPSSVWAADIEGLGNYRIGDDNSLTVLSEKYRPEGIVTEEVYYLKFDYTGALWMGNLGSSQIKKEWINNQNDYPFIRQQTTRIKNNVPEDVSLLEASASRSNTINLQKENNSTRMYGGTLSFAIDPENPDRYFQTNNLEGLYVIEKQDGKWVELHRFDLNNTPMDGNGWHGYKDVQFDPDGNLWVGLWAKDATIAPYYVLPKSVLRSKNYKDIAKSDWIPAKQRGVDVGGKDVEALFCTKSPVIITKHSKMDGFAYTKTNGTLSDPTDDTYVEIERTVDQDGKEWGPSLYTVCLVEDKRGRVWIGTSAGIVEISDPASLTPDSRVTRLKVPRNDGTNYADYLCESDFIYSIAVDNTNRKWIATESSGVYLVSENGDRIIEHFTTENSPLPTNKVLSVACDPNSNVVYFGLPSGLMSYNSTAAPAADDYSNVYAFPNPVHPDYTGYVTITGLMDNSLVKITDVQNHVVYQTRSEGGLAVWDTNDSERNPVKSGVYFVIASRGAEGGSESVVTKIMVIR